MRILQGSKLITADAGYIEAKRGGDRRVVIDVGAGDGRYVYESARSDPDSLYVALDPDADALAEYAYRASRKPARGGIANAVFVVASIEQLPAELSALADLVRINFPWGSLLRGLLLPETAVIAAIAGLGAPGARFELVLAYDPGHDTGAFAGDPLPALDLGYIDAVLTPAYAASGLRIEERRRLTQDEALAIPSTWGRRLLHARPRDAYFIAGAVVANGEIV